MSHSAFLWLAASAVLTGSLWIPIIINRIRENGAWNALRNPNRDERPKAAWADRLMWAHANAVENLVVFAALVFTAHAVGVRTEMMVTATAVYFFARLLHALIYTAGVPLLRTLAFVAGYAAQIAVAIEVFRAAA